MTALSALFDWIKSRIRANDGERLSVASIARVAKAAADGDLNARIIGIPIGHPLADLAWSTNRLLDITEAYCKETFAAVEHANRRQYYRKIEITGLRGSFVAFAETVNAALKLMEERDDRFFKFADQNIRSTVESVTSTVAALTETAAKTRQISQESAHHSKMVAVGVGEMSESAQTVAAAVEQMSAAIREISVQVERTAALSRDSVAVAETTKTQIGALSNAADQIGAAVKLIEDIASKTRMLAFNATIEAQRAGASGSGFAVVAEEVKHLSVATATATSEITTLVASVRAASSKVSAAIDRITATIIDMDAAATIVSSSIEQQNAVTQEIAQNVTAVAQKSIVARSAVETVEIGTQTVNLAAIEIANSAGALSGVATGLNQQTRAFVTDLARIT